MLICHAYVVVVGHTHNKFCYINIILHVYQSVCTLQLYTEYHVPLHMLHALMFANLKQLAFLACMHVLQLEGNRRSTKELDTVVHLSYWVVRDIVTQCHHNTESCAILSA